MIQPLALVRSFSLAALVVVVLSLPGAIHAAPPFAEFIDPNPNSGNGFGTHVVALSTGNVVITSPGDDAGGGNAGAVYLFNGATGALISTLTGSTGDDFLEVRVTALTNGNYVVSLPRWNSGTITDVGAVVWGSGITGVNGTIGIHNSLVGSKASDQVGIGGATALTNGNYVVSSSEWDSGTVIDSGAATWGNGTTGTFGTVSSTNSLVGTKAGDRVSSEGVTALTNGHYVVSSPSWSNGAINRVGAATWGDGATGIVGPVSTGNSLVGSEVGDTIGSNGVTALTNGNYVVRSPLVGNEDVINIGAVTWGNGSTGLIGTVSHLNSLVGSSTNDKVGDYRLVALTNGNYVVVSIYWDNGSIPDAGAVTWVDGASGTSGTVNSTNSLVGSTAHDLVGDRGVTALANGNYVVMSDYWDNGSIRDAGAATWGNGSTGISGTINNFNSLVGSSALDRVSYSGVTALTNGNYVVCSNLWDNGSIQDAGAATWGDGTTGIAGEIGPHNSLVGNAYDDRVGGAATALTNGNYVVCSPEWKNGVHNDAGAATWGNGTTGISGAVSPGNSFVGSFTSDEVGRNVTALSNGNYVVISPSWRINTTEDAGAVTWGDGATGSTGTVNISNSLVGSNVYDSVGNGQVLALTNGNYVVRSPSWRNGAFYEAGAVTWGDGVTGSSGRVSSNNSLVGLTTAAGLHEKVVTDNINQTYIARFLTEGGGKVRLGSQLNGLTSEISVTATTPNAVEGGNTGLFTFSRTGTAGSFTVGFQLEASSAATSGTDFTLSSTGPLTYNTGTGAGTIVIPAGESSVTVTLAALVESPNPAEGPETVRLSVVAGSGYVVAATPGDLATVTITENSFMVTTTADSGEGSLRQAIENANSLGGNPTITFEGRVYRDGTADVIRLDGTEIGIDGTLTLAGPGADLLTVSADQASRVFRIACTVPTDEATIRGLTIADGDADNGGAIIVVDGGLTAEDCLFTGNAANDDGGAIHAIGTSLDLIDCVFTNNQAGQGGAISTRSGGSCLRCRFEGNFTGEDGGAAEIDGGIFVIADSLFTGNTADDEGGAIDNNASSLTLVNCTISGNTADTAGGGINNQGGLTVVNCTVTGNRADADGVEQTPGTPDEGFGGGGIRTDDDRGIVTLSNTIVAGNRRGAPGTDVAADLSTALPMIVGVAPASANNLIGDPGFVGELVHGANGNFIGKDNGAGPRIEWPLAEILNPVLAANGGSTLTHSLVIGSPAIDGGANALAVDGTSTPLVNDQRGLGFARITKGLASATVDIGAYELFAVPGFTNATPRVHVGTTPLNLAGATGPTLPGGVFSGPGVIGGFFDPTGLAPGLYRVMYLVKDAFGVMNVGNVLVTVDEPDLPAVLELWGLKRFKPSEVGKTGRSQRVTLRNTGGSEVKGLSLLVTGPADRDFRVSGPAVRSLKPGESTAVTIEFRAGEEGLRKATLVVSTNDPSISIEALLSGRGKNSGVRPPRPGSLK